MAPDFLIGRPVAKRDRVSLLQINMEKNHEQNYFTAYTVKIYRSGQCHWQVFIFIVLVHCEIEEKNNLLRNIPLRNAFHVAR